jgi:hypothetical protein
MLTAHETTIANATPEELLFMLDTASTQAERLSILASFAASARRSGWVDGLTDATKAW